MKTLLVTGASGFLGWNICQRANADWTIFGTVYSHSAKIPGVALVKIDLTLFNDLKNLFRNAKLNPCSQQEIQMAAPRTRDVSLTNANAMQMGFQPEPVRLSLERIRPWAMKKYEKIKNINPCESVRVLKNNYFPFFYYVRKILML
jgi:nucleoside-diphosphate-sugar epimerase